MHRSLLKLAVLAGAAIIVACGGSNGEETQPETDIPVASTQGSDDGAGPEAQVPGDQPGSQSDELAERVAELESRVDTLQAELQSRGESLQAQPPAEPVPGGANDEVVASALVGRIAFSWRDDRGTAIYVMNADGTDRTLIASPGRFDFEPSWSPDGTHIVFHSQTMSPNFIYIVNADGTNLTQISPFGDRNSNQDAAFSPDGTRLAFTSSRDFPCLTVSCDLAPISTRSFSIYVMNVDGTEVIHVTPGDSFDSGPAWSPDGTRLAFTSRPEGGLGDNQIYVVNADGGSRARLTFSGTDFDPAWSPDGIRLAFTSERDGNLEIYVMNADGSDPVRLTFVDGSDTHPTWSPDGTRIAFSSTRDGGGSEIYVMNADGTDPIRLTFEGGFAPDWSP